MSDILMGPPAMARQSPRAGRGLFACVRRIRRRYDLATPDTVAELVAKFASPL